MRTSQKFYRHFVWLSYIQSSTPVGHILLLHVPHWSCLY